MKYGELTLGQTEAIVNKLGGMEGVIRFLSGDLVVIEAVRQFKVWKTIKLGTGLKTAGDFSRALRSGGIEVSSWPQGLFRNPAYTVAVEETEVDLIKVTVAELGFKEGVRRDQLYERAREVGLELCPPEVGPQLRLQYKNQPKDECVFVGMEPIARETGSVGVFTVKCDALRYQWLDSYFIASEDHYNSPFRPEFAWVFVRPRK